MAAEDELNEPPPAEAMETGEDGPDGEEDVSGDGPAGTPAFKRCLEQVRLNASCFASWSLLLAEAEASQNAMLESIFGQFLANFPQLYGYWNKYARCVYARAMRESGGDLEAAASEACAVYERGVAATGGASVDLWVKYGEFLALESGLPPPRVRGVLARACAASAYDPRSPLVFRALCRYEEGLGDKVRLLAAYRQACGAAQTTEPDDLGVPGREEVLELVGDLAAAVDDWGPDCGTCDDFLCACGAENNQARKRDKARAPYELRLRRAYYHVKPLDDGQLAAWRAYLDFEERQGDAARTRALYERCLVVCANYPEFWCRYATWLEDPAEAAAALERGAAFLKQAPDLRLLLALFHEAAGRVDAARDVYEDVCERVAPGLLEAVVAFAQFERRCGNLEDVVAIYRDALARATSATVKAFVAAHLARFQHTVLRDANAARCTLEAAIRANPATRDLWVAYYTLEAQADDGHAMDRVALLFKHALGDDAGLARSDQATLWELYLHHVEDLGPSVDQVLQVRDDHDAWKRKKKAGARAAAN